MGSLRILLIISAPIVIIFVATLAYLLFTLPDDNNTGIRSPAELTSIRPTEVSTPTPELTTPQR